MSATTLPGLLRRLLDHDPARPLVTFYDDATGERVELSVRSFENWVAKTANLLQDDLSAEPFEHVALWLPAHWQSAVWVFAAAACGTVVSHRRPATAPDRAPDVVVCDPDALEDAAAAGAREVVALALRPMGQGFGPGDAALPAGATDYARSVLAQGDVFLPLTPPAADAPFLATADGTLTQSALLAQARERAQALGLGRGARLLTDANPADPAGLAGGLLAAMVQEGSLVLTRHPDPAAVDGRSAQEQVTDQWWAGG